MRPATLALLALCSSGCMLNFDPQLYMDRADARSETGGFDAGDGGRDGGTDAAPGDAPTTDVPGDGTPVVPFADRCQGTLPLVRSSTTTFVMDTTNLHDDFSQVAMCTGSEQPGNDGFFAVDMRQGERWHFHIRIPSGSTVNPSVYIVPSCDERSCQVGDGLDECGAGRPEHISFVAPSTGRFIVGVDSRTPGGTTYEILALHPICGDRTKDHGESCDDGNNMAGDGCDATCHAELTGTLAVEVEPNDESTNANVLLPGQTQGTATVRGQLGGSCDFDMYEFSVPAGGSVRATVLDSNGVPCGASMPAMRLALYQSDGRVEVGAATGAAGTCPAIGDTDAFARGLDAGTYFLRISTPQDQATAFFYRMRVEVLAP